MAIDVSAERRAIVAELEAAARPGRGEALQAYLGSPYPVLGLTTPEQRAILRSFWREHRRVGAGEVNGLASALWAGRSLEEKAMAISLLARYAKVLDGDSWRLADRWVDEAVGWALSDSLAAGPISSMLVSRPERFKEVLAWTRAEHLWRRRAAAYAMRNPVLAGQLDRPLRVLGRLLYDRELWVQRAVGTWLRESWKKDRRKTEAFLRARVRGLPPVVITVATERAPKAFRDELRGKSRATAKGPSRRQSRASRRRRP